MSILKHHYYLCLKPFLVWMLKSRDSVIISSLQFIIGLRYILTFQKSNRVISIHNVFTTLPPQLYKYWLNHTPSLKFSLTPSTTIPHGPIRSLRSCCIRVRIRRRTRGRSRRTSLRGRRARSRSRGGRPGLTSLRGGSRQTPRLREARGRGRTAEIKSHTLGIFVSLK